MERCKCGIYLYETKDGNQAFTWDWFDYFEGDWLEAGSPHLFYEMQEELRNEFLSFDREVLYRYTITNTKTKYGTVRWYDMGNTDNGYKIVSKYCRLFEDEMEIEPY